MIVLPGILSVGLFLLRIALGVLMLIAAQSKLAYRIPDYVAVLDSYRVIPKSAYWIGLYVVPRVEAFVALGLLFGVRVPFFAWLLVALLTIYTGLVIMAITKKVDADCRCFGSRFSSKLGWPMVVGNLVFIGLAMTLTLTSSVVFGIDALGLTGAQSWYYVMSLAVLALVFMPAGAKYVKW